MQLRIMFHIRNLNLGKLKTWQARLITYTGMVQFLMIFYLFIMENTWFEWYIWLFLMTAIIVFTVIFDTLFVLPGQLEYNFIKNPEWIKHKNNQKKIMEHLGLEYEE